MREIFACFGIGFYLGFFRLATHLANPPIPPRVEKAYAQDWLEGWNFRKKITIDHTKIDENLTDFPVRVYLDQDADIGIAARNDGYDIRFTDSDGQTELKYEREDFVISDNKATGNFWVKIPSVSSSTGTDFYIYYGNVIAGDGQDAADVWSNGYVAVYHLNQTGTNPQVLDSTANGNNSTAAAWTPTTSGQVGSGGSFNGSSQSIAFPDSTSFATIATNKKVTVSVWVNWTSSTESYNAVAGRYSSATLNGMELLFKSNQKIAWYLNNSGGYIDGGGASVPFGQWTFVNGTYDGSQMRTYINGSINQGPTNFSGSIGGGTETVKIAKDQYGAGRWFKGTVDEVRISNTARSAAWIKADFHSGNDSLLSYEGEEAKEPTLSTAIQVNAQDYITSVSTITFPEAEPGTTVSQPYNNIDGSGSPQIFGGAGTAKPVVTLYNGGTSTLRIWYNITTFTNSVVSSEYYLINDKGAALNSADDITNAVTFDQDTSTGTTIAPGTGNEKDLYLKIVLSSLAGKTGTSTLTILGETL